MKPVNIATLNIGAASKLRAQRILTDWVADSDFDVFVFTESSEGDGTELIVSAFSDVGWKIFRRRTELGDRGVVVASRIQATEDPTYPLDDPAPGRAIMINLDTDPQITLIGMYVPNRGNDLTKTGRKQAYLDCWLKYISRRTHSHERILMGDFNVVPTEQTPAFLPQDKFEYNWYSKLCSESGLYDAAVAHNRGGHESTWVAHLGEGYTYDHIFIEHSLKTRISAFRYDHATRHRDGITDHSGLAVTVSVDRATVLETTKIGTPRQASLF